MRQGTKLLIFQYSDYRKFLADFYKKLKEEDKAFSYRSFARWAGFASPSFILSVIQGKTNLSPQSASALAEGMELSAKEKKFFCLLVLLNQSKDDEEKSHYANQILSLKAFSEANPLSAASGEYLSKWYISAIKELIAIESFQEDADWISEALGRDVSAKDLKAAIQCLLKIGLIQRKDSGKLHVVNDAVISTDEINLSFLHDFHVTQIEMAKEALQRFEQELREIQAFTLPVTEEGFKELRQMIFNFRDSLFALAERQRDPQFLCQVNLQLFPASKPPGKLSDVRTKKA
ncbi:MAG: TIGR02147 family protein [Bdellovibrionales bacterium]|nr:TIGR02147 family protein [Bdellovibrionales bacterium]